MGIEKFPALLGKIELNGTSPWLLGLKLSHVIIIMSINQSSLKKIIVDVNYIKIYRNLEHIQAPDENRLLKNFAYYLWKYRKKKKI